VSPLPGQNWRYPSIWRRQKSVRRNIPVKEVSYTFFEDYGGDEAKEYVVLSNNNCERSDEDQHEESFIK
jgi:hypothetical protein